MEVKNKAFNVILNIFFILLALACVLPVILVISISFTDASEIAAIGYKLVPSRFVTDAYRYIFEDGQKIINAYVVTVLTTVIGTTISTLVISLYAYPLSRESVKYKKFFTFFVFFTMLFGGGLVAWYITCTRYLHLSNTLWGLIFPYSVSAWYIIIMRTFFQTTVPASLVESAKLDGAGEFLILFKIVFPISVPGIATIALFQCLTYWNDYWLPLMLITDTKLYNLQFLLQSVLQNIQQLSEGLGNSSNTNTFAVEIPTESVRMALCVVAMGPILIAYPFFQKYFIQGLTVGSVKG